MAINTMNIYSKKGDKIKVTINTKYNGYTYDKELVEKYLEIDKEYTVEKTIVDRYHTDVILQEFPNKMFNSVNFENVK